MKESRNREKEKKYKEKEVNLYIFNEKCTFFRKQFSMTKKKVVRIFKKILPPQYL